MFEGVSLTSFYSLHLCIFLSFTESKSIRGHSDVLALGVMKKVIRLWRGALVLSNVKERKNMGFQLSKNRQHHDMDFFFSKTRKGSGIPAT
jgi:hypothetical protein